MKENAYFCPNCGSPAIERSSLAGGNATCASCEWTGKTEDVREVPFDTGFASPEAITQRFAAELSGIVAKSLAQPVGSFLLKWGFIDPENLALELGVYMKQMSIAVAKSIIETRQGLATGALRHPTPKPPEQRKGQH